MVVFTCNACGDTIKKAQVSLHCGGQCRQRHRAAQLGVSCMDCGRDFSVQSCQAHTQCVSEREKYAPAGWQPPASCNKGQHKQQQWAAGFGGVIDRVLSSGEVVDPQLRALLQQLANCANVPRKRAKYDKFVANSLRVRNATLAARAWDVIAQAQKQQQEAADTSSSRNDQAESVKNSNKSLGKQNGIEKCDGDNNNNNGADESQTTDQDKQKLLNKRERKLARSGKSVTSRAIKKRHRQDDDEGGDDGDDHMQQEQEQPSRKSKKGRLADESNGTGKAAKKSRKQAGFEPATKPVVATPSVEDIMRPDFRANGLPAVNLNSTDATATSGGGSPDCRVDGAVGRRFDWTAAIVAAFKNETQVAVKKLRRRVLAAFMAHEQWRADSSSCTTVSHQLASAKFSKKLARTAGKVRVTGDWVELVQDSS